MSRGPAYQQAPEAEQDQPARGEAETVDPPAAAPGGVPVALLRSLQRTAGNTAVSGLLAREPTATAPPAGPSVKNTLTYPEKKLGQKDLEYVEVTLSVGGSADYEFTPAAAPPAATAPEGQTPKPEGDGGGPTPLASPKEADVKGSGGVNVGTNEAKYQAEVGVEFEKHAAGLLEGSTPKAKIGGEANADKGKLGVEISAEGELLEPKFAFNLVEMDAQKGIHFATLETAVDWKIHEWTFAASDGTSIKVTPKATLKVAIEPNYEAIFKYLLEEGGADVIADAAIAGGLILGGVAAIAGTLLTLGDGEDEARAIDNADKARTQLVAGFVGAATGQKVDIKDDFTMEGSLRGKQWRDDLQAGQRGRGIPVPPSVIDEKSKEAEAKIRESAEKTANDILHGELVRRYWEIHYIQREVPWAEIDTVFMMLMEGQGFGRPGPQEGKNVAGASVLPE